MNERSTCTALRPSRPAAGCLRPRRRSPATSSSNSSRCSRKSLRHRKIGSSLMPCARDSAATKRYTARVMSDAEAAIGRRIAQIKTELAQLGPVRPGHLSQQYNVCGTPGCRCKAAPPEKHGPYYQISYTWQGKSSSQFVRRENLTAVQQQLRNYERLREQTWPKTRRKTRIRSKTAT